MGLTLLRVCCQTYDFIGVCHTNRSEGVFYDGSIEWE